jgi:dCMP deaminase
MIIQSIKHNFLILGFTGPLRSGCTTAANFFVNNPQQVINEYLSTSDDQLKIEELYREVFEPSAENPLQDRYLKRKKQELNEALKQREIKKVLRSDNIPTFQYISMSAMLLKYSIEYFLNNKIGKTAHKYKDIITFIENENFDKRKINSINQKIKKKRYRDISENELEFYDAYLLKIDKLITKLKNNYNDEPESFGSILQDIGDNIRKHGNPFRDEGLFKSDCVYRIAEQANWIIKFFRNRQDATSKRRHHFVIECFRNPYEVEYFRFRYYEFYLISLYSSYKIREKRGSLSKEQDVRDSGEKNKIHELFKQNVARCVYLSDIAINNEASLDELYNKLIKYYALIVNPGCITPTSNETFMNQAYSLSLRSSCISRQVGAVIIGKNGYVVGAGWNDAGEGQIGCGYRSVIDIKKSY